MTLARTPRSAVVALAAALLLLPVATSSAAERVLQKASFLPLWSPQAQFAGYYTALEKGLYRKHGIDLTLIAGGPDLPPAEALKSGEADFAVLWLATAIRARSAGVRLVNLAQIVQKSSLMLVARKASEIKTPADLDGRKVGLWEGPLSIAPRAFFKKYGLAVQVVPQSYTVNLFLRGGIDAASAMWYNEYHTLLSAGLDPEDLTVFFLKDHGLDLPEDGLYCLEKTLQRDPSLAEGFRRASLEGWRYAFAHPEEALDIIIRAMQAAKIPANRVHQRWMLDRMRDLLAPEGGKGDAGVLRREDYEAAGQILLKDGFIREVPDYTAFAGGADVRP